MTQKQKNAWLLLAMLAPMAHGSGAGWASVLLAEIAFLPLCSLPACYEKLPRWLSWILWLTVVMAAGILLPGSGTTWPGEASSIVVPLSLLAVAVLTEQDRYGANACTGLFLLSLPLMGAVCILAGKEVQMQWLKPGDILWKPELLLTLLLPRLSAVWIPQRKAGKELLIIALGGIAVAALVQGIVSPGVAMKDQAPLYLMARSLQLGSLSRLEPVVSVLMTMSWFALSAYLFHGGKSLLEEGGINEKTGTWITAGTIAAAIVFTDWIPKNIGLFSALLGWVMVPILIFQKRSKKDEKRC